MNIILMFLTGLEVVIALLIIVVILMQRSKSGGGLGALSGGVTEEVLGAGAGNFLTKTTVVLSLVFLVNTLLVVVLQGNITRNKNVSIVDSLDKGGVNLIKSPTETEEGTTEEQSTATDEQGETNGTTKNTVEDTVKSEKESQTSSSVTEKSSSTDSVNKAPAKVPPGGDSAKPE